MEKDKFNSNLIKIIICSLVCYFILDRCSQPPPDDEIIHKYSTFYTQDYTYNSEWSSKHTKLKENGWLSDSTQELTIQRITDDTGSFKSMMITDTDADKCGSAIGYTLKTFKVNGVNVEWKKYCSITFLKRFVDNYAYTGTDPHYEEYMLQESIYYPATKKDIDTVKNILINAKKSESIKFDDYELYSDGFAKVWNNSKEYTSRKTRYGVDRIDSE